MMDCQAYRSLVAAHIDHALEPHEQIEADTHVQSCVSCAQLRTEVDAGRHIARKYAPRHTTPGEVRARLLRALELEAEENSSTSGRAGPSLRLRRLYLLVGAVAAVAVLLIAHPFRSPKIHLQLAPDVLDVVVEDVRRANADQLPLEVRSDQVDVLREFYRRTEKFPFDDTVADFRHLGLRPVGAMLSSVGDVPTTLTVYDGPTGKVVCRRFLADALPLPVGPQRIGEPTTIRLDGVTVRIHQIGSVVCLLAGALPEEALTSLPHRASHLD